MRMMKMEKYRLPAVIFFVLTLFTCIDPYTQQTGRYKPALVVDALLTDESQPAVVRLSRSRKSASDSTQMVSGAYVTITDDFGNTTILNETGNGIYITDTLSFRAAAGRTYSLYIKTAEGEEYRSESCPMYPAQEPDSIFYLPAQVIEDNKIYNGIRIYAASKPSSGCEYCRWTFDEWWKIRASNPREYNYVNDSTFTPYTPVRQTCWSHHTSSDIILRSSEDASSVPVTFIAGEKSPRLLLQYCIEVKQLSLSAREYEYWNQMSQIEKSGGDIFDRQPSKVSGNINCLSNPGETVLGYFQVSAVKIKRKYITYNDAERLGIAHYEYPCTTFMVGLNDFPGSPGSMTFDKIYWLYTNKGYIFVKPLFTMSGDLVRLEFETDICADCTLSGSFTKPEFWVDL